jgi:hypothetical protein
MTIQGIRVAILVVAIGSAACDRPAAPPTAPSAPDPPPAPMPAPANVASLAIEGHAIAYLLPPNSYGDVYGYHARFLIHETRGQVGATILNVWPVSPEDPDGGYSYGPECFGRTVHVAAGETLDTFFTDAGVATLRCAPEAWSTHRVEQIPLHVKYLDDANHGGVVDTTLEVIGP